MLCHQSCDSYYHMNIESIELHIIMTSTNIVVTSGVGMKFKLGGGGGADLVFSCVILLNIKNDPKN